MLRTASDYFTIDEFRVRFAEEKPYYEYWFGEAVQKSVPTWLHSLLQLIVCEFLTRAGYRAGPEIELRIDPDWQPKPDVVAALVVEHPYPTKPVDVVVEIISPEDRMNRMFEKRQQYARIGIRKIFVMDPQLHYAWEWNAETENLERVSTMLLLNGEHIGVAELWNELDHRSNGRVGKNQPRTTTTSSPLPTVSLPAKQVFRYPKWFALGIAAHSFGTATRLRSLGPPRNRFLEWDGKTNIESSGRF
jgi:Uma2 family endonuclease